MTRQQRRFQARQTGKPQLVSKDAPFFYGAFYKDDTADGFAFTVDSKKGPQNEYLISLLLDTAERMIKDYPNMTVDQRRAFVADQWTLMKESKDKFNSIVFPEGRKGFVRQIPQEAVEHALLAGTAIHFLTDIGEIENDEYNGMHFMYNNVRVDMVS